MGGAERKVIEESVDVERRCYISRLAADAKVVLRAGRSHWQAEKSLH